MTIGQWLQIPRLGEGGKAAVIGLFHIIRKTATGQLLAPEVVLQAVCGCSRDSCNYRNPCFCLFYIPSQCPFMF
jgi:hypothetical protein